MKNKKLCNLLSVTENVSRNQFQHINAVYVVIAIVIEVVVEA